MGVGDSTMGLGIILFVTAVMFSDAAPLKRQAYFNKTAYLPCPFTNPHNISQTELVIFWQDQKKLVLYELYLGREKLDNVNAKYLGRTRFDKDNSALQLDNVQIKDKGSYDCFIQHKTSKGLVVLQKIDSELSVLANFSEPKILKASNTTEHPGINLICSSTQGYPKPTKMYFWLKTQNSTTEYPSVMQLSQDNVTELYTVSISSSLPFPDGTRNATIFCILETRLVKIFSQPYSIAPEGPVHDQENGLSKITPAIGLIMFFCIMVPVVVVVLCKKKKKEKKEKKEKEKKEKKKQQSSLSYEETTKMKNDEREETEEEKAKIYIPERNNEEIQSVVYSSKPSFSASSTTHN